MSSSQSDLHSHRGRERVEVRKRSSRGEGGEEASVREGRFVCRVLAITLRDQFRAGRLGHTLNPQGNIAPTRLINSGGHWNESTGFFREDSLNISS